MVTPEFRCIILKRPIKGKIMSRKYFGCGSPQKFLNRIIFFDKIFLFIKRYLKYCYQKIYVNLL